MPLGPLNVPCLSSGEFKERTKAIGPLKGMSFSSDGRLLALGGEDGAVELWEWPQMQRKLRWVGRWHAAWVCDLGLRR